MGGTTSECDGARCLSNDIMWIIRFIVETAESPGCSWESKTPVDILVDDHETGMGRVEGSTAPPRYNPHFAKPNQKIHPTNPLLPSCFSVRWVQFPDSRSRVSSFDLPSAISTSTDPSRTRVMRIPKTSRNFKNGHETLEWIEAHLDPSTPRCSTSDAHIFTRKESNEIRINTGRSECPIQ